MTSTLLTALMFAGSPTAAETPATWRVGGDLFATAESHTGPNGDVIWESGDVRITTPLPEGYPAPTPPGAIEVKRYPAVRRAEASGDSGLSFWKLFRHIKSREIAMTAPVEIDYEGLESDGTRPDGKSMAFLYRTRDLGPEGEDGSVSVYDAEPLMVAALGARGRNDWRTAAAGLEILERWLAGQDEWVVAGEPRTLHYNGPDVRPARRWMEVQLPVRRVPTE